MFGFCPARSKVVVDQSLEEYGDSYLVRVDRVILSAAKDLLDVQ